MVCEYAIFTFPDCGCPALVPIQYCPHHLDPSNTAYEPNPKSLRNPARITMLFKAPGIPLHHEDYMSLVTVYRDPFLRNDYSDEERERLLEFRDALIEMQKKDTKLSDGTTVPTAGFHTKLCRYHVIWPNCKELQVWRVTEPFFPFLETKCFKHSNCIRADDSEKGWGIYTQQVPERFEECIKEKFLEEWRRLEERVDDVDDEELVHRRTITSGESHKAKEPNAKRKKPTDKPISTASTIIIDEDLNYEDPPTPSSKDGDEGSEYEGSDGDESDDEDEPTVTTVRQENNAEQTQKKRQTNQPKEPKKASEKRSGTGAQEPAHEHTQKTDKKKKKNAPKRKRNNDSDAEWKDDNESHDSDETITEKIPQNPAPQKQIAIQDKTKPAEPGHKPAADSDFPAHPHEPRIKNTKEAAKMDKTPRDNDHEAELQPTEKPKKKTTKKAKKAGDDEEYEDESSDFQDKTPRPNRNNRANKKKTEKESEYDDATSKIETQNVKPKPKRSNRGNANKKAVIQDLVGTDDTAMRIYRPTHEYHKAGFFENTGDEAELQKEDQKARAGEDSMSTDDDRNKVGFDIDESFDGRI
ncbi:hypothetical protein TWF696_004908 [Orbilia brochopaga]|uniref:Uncharacterized protein n=1 Tax=Orbilia brochopaga TaxID=3140254 RepID=A0AAV9UZ79_9PEZI